MGIGYRIKEAREHLGLTQTELGKMLGVTGSSITNYEKETSHPKEQIIYKLMETLNVDANYLFQDFVNIKSKENDITLTEYEHIKKYRILDAHGQDMVDTVLDKEYTRCISSGKIHPFPEQVLNAANDKGATEEQKANADSIMTDDSEWE